MKNLTLAVMFLCARILAHGAACPIAPLTTYLNSGDYFSCTQNVTGQTIEFNHDILPSFVALNLLSTNDSSANPANVNVIPEDLGLRFDSADLPDNSVLHSSQAALVHFLIDGGSNPIVDTLLSVDSSATSLGGLGSDSVLMVGQELVCMGGTFTSLPTGFVTDVKNGILKAGAFGCKGTALIETVADGFGPRDIIKSVLGFSSLSAVSSKVVIHLSPFNVTKADVIKLQALLLSVTGGSATAGFGNTLMLTSSAPEPGSGMLVLGTGITVAFCKWLRRLRSAQSPVTIKQSL